MDTCRALPAKVDAPAAFGILGLERELFPFDWTICQTVMDHICNRMNAQDTTAGRWYFMTTEAYLDDGDISCQMGFWLPGEPFAAPKPLPDQCRGIFGAMVNVAQSSDKRLYGATVNLAVNPADGRSQWPLPGGSGTGKPYPIAGFCIPNADFSDRPSGECWISKLCSSGEGGVAMLPGTGYWLVV